MEFTPADMQIIWTWALAIAGHRLPVDDFADPLDWSGDADRAEDGMGPSLALASARYGAIKKEAIKEMPRGRLLVGGDGNTAYLRWTAERGLYTVIEDD